MAESGRKTEIDPNMFKKAVPFASMEDIFSPILEYLFSDDYKKALTACLDTKESGFMLGLTMAPMIIWKNAPKIFIQEDAIDSVLAFAENGRAENGRAENTSVDEEKT